MDPSLMTFRRPMILRAPEGDGADSGDTAGNEPGEGGDEGGGDEGGSGDDAAQGDDGGKRYTADELEAIVQKRLERDRRSRSNRGRRRRQQQPPKEPQNAEPSRDSQWARWAEFQEEVDIPSGLTKGQRKRMRLAFFAELDDIDDPDAWATGYLEDMGLTQQQGNDNPNDTGNDEPEPKKPASPPRSDTGGASAVKDYETMIDPNQLTANDKKRMYQKYGPRKANRMIREMMEKHYDGREIVMPER